MGKINKFFFLLIFLLFLITKVYSQKKIEFDGQLSLFGNYNPDGPPHVLLGGRYVPEINYRINLDSGHALSFEGSVNMQVLNSFNSNGFQADIQPYRIWARYINKRYEIRIGLQKIDFGSSTLLRPLQWFNQIDPRDPLQLTYGVYGILTRYYFLNNANIWLWGLWGNEKPRGYDFIKTYKESPEWGGRIQYPVPKGELAISYHHRTAAVDPPSGAFSYILTPEDRIGLEGKWDITLGAWFEASYTHKTKNVGLYTDQAFFNVGIDYTFEMGNGLYSAIEHLITLYGQDLLKAHNYIPISAATVSYPMGFFDTLTTVFYYDWNMKNITFFINYAHQFNTITGYVMAYFNPDTQQGIQKNELVDHFSGPGVRLMLVYDH